MILRVSHCRVIEIARLKPGVSVAVKGQRRRFHQLIGRAGAKCAEPFDIQMRQRLADIHQATEIGDGKRLRLFRELVRLSLQRRLRRIIKRDRIPVQFLGGGDDGQHCGPPMRVLLHR